MTVLSHTEFQEENAQDPAQTETTTRQVHLHEKNVVTVLSHTEFQEDNAQDPAQTETTTTPEEVQMSPIVIPVCDEKSLQIWTSFVKRPSIAWVWSFNMKQATVFCTTYDNSETFNTVIVKTVAIRLSGELHFMYNGINITHCELPTTFSNFKTLSTTIELFDKLQPCEGITIPSSKLMKYSDDFVGFKDGNGNWRSKHCSYVFDKKYVTTSCTRCRAMKKYFFQKIARIKCRKDKESMNDKCKKLRSKLATMEKKLEVINYEEVNF